jgi:hypothetical protein
MLTRRFEATPDNPATMSIYTLNPTILLEADATKTRKRKHHVPEVSTLTQLDKWLDGLDGDVSISLYE